MLSVTCLPNPWYLSARCMQVIPCTRLMPPPFCNDAPHRTHCYRQASVKLHRIFDFRWLRGTLHNYKLRTSHPLSLSCIVYWRPPENCSLASNCSDISIRKQTRSE